MSTFLELTRRPISGTVTTRINGDGKLLTLMSRWSLPSVCGTTTSATVRYHCPTTCTGTSHVAQALTAVAAGKQLSRRLLSYCYPATPTSTPGRHSPTRSHRNCIQTTTWSDSHGSLVSKFLLLN